MLFSFYMMTCYGFCKMQNDLVVGIMFSLVVLDKLSCFLLFSFDISIFFSKILNFCLCDYRCHTAENEADGEIDEGDKLEKQAEVQ